MVQCLHKLSSCVSPVISSFICCRAGEVGSLDLRSSRVVVVLSTHSHDPS